MSYSSRAVHLARPVGALNTIPSAPHSLIGRERELEAVRGFLGSPEIRVLTITGPAGVGKTRLALAIAITVAESYADGVWFVSLAAVRTPELAMPAIVEALGVDGGQAPALDVLKEYLHGQEMLLILDNFEQIVPAGVDLAELLAACPHLKVLVTSREVLHIRAECQFSLAPLDVPKLTALETAPTAALDLEEMGLVEQNASVRLFVQRAQAALPIFRLTRENARSVAQICIRLEGIPLALELAAPRLIVLSPEALLARLERRLQLLTGGSQDLPDRQRTLLVTIAWSYDLLSEPERQLVRRLAVFAQGCAVPEIVGLYQHLQHLPVERTSAEADAALLEQIASLYAKSLLQRTEIAGEEPRFHLLEMVREFGLSCLEAEGEEEAVRQAHALTYLELAEAAHPELSTSHQERWWLDRLDRDGSNLRAAFAWLVEDGERGIQEGDGQRMEPALRLGGALERYWLPRGFGPEEMNLLSRALIHRGGASPTIQAKALFAMGDVSAHAGELTQARASGEQLLALCREQGDSRGSAKALYLLGLVALFRRHAGEALDRLHEALSLRRQIGDQVGIAWSLLDLARAVVSADGDPEDAATWLAESLAIFQQHGHQRGIARVYDEMGSLALALGDLPAARRHFEQALPHFSELGVRRGIYSCEANLALITLYQGDLDAASHYAEASALTARQLGASEGNPDALFGTVIRVLAQPDGDLARETVTRVVTQYQDHEDAKNTLEMLGLLATLASTHGVSLWAARLWAVGHRIRETAGMPLRRVERGAYERQVGAARAQGGERAFLTAWSEGLTMTVTQVLASGDFGRLVGPVRPSVVTSEPSLASPSRLTSRELEVLRLLAEGLTDVAIGKSLVIEPTTVHSHIGSIFAKLGVKTRAAATRAALDRHLL